MHFKALCDRNAACIAFIRRAVDDVGYLGMSMSSRWSLRVVLEIRFEIRGLKLAKEDPTKLLDARSAAKHALSASSSLLLDGFHMENGLRP